MRPSGISGIKISAWPTVMSVAVGPGWTLLTVIAREVRSIAYVADHRGDSRVVIEYMLASGNAVQTAVLLPTVMILPPSARCGTEAKRLGGSRGASSQLAAGSSRARALGKMNTLAYRVTHLILTGTVKSCILLLATV
jgi:hypothetical protein